MELKSAGTQQGVDQVTIQGIAYSCKLDHDHIQHIVPTSKLETVLSAENTAQPMCAPPYARSHSLESSAGCKLLRPTAIKVEARCPSSHGTARGIAQHSTPSFRQTSTAGHLAQTNRKPRCHDASATKPTIASRYLHLHHQLQTNLVGAHCVGYCNGVRQTAVKESLIFSQDDISTCFDPAAASKQAQLQQPHPQQQTQHSNVPSLAAGSEHDSKSLVAEGMQTSVPSLHGQSNTLQHQVQQPQPPQQHMQQPLCHQQLPSQQKPALHGKADSLSGNVEHTPREKRKCVISGPEATSQAGGKRPGSLIKFR